jgi:hypothetical protein
MPPLGRRSARIFRSIFARCSGVRLRIMTPPAPLTRSTAPLSAESRPELEAEAPASQHRLVLGRLDLASIVPVWDQPLVHLRSISLHRRR